MSAPTLMVGATLPGNDRDVWTGEEGSLQWASRQALGAHQRALGALIAVIGSREITAGVEPAHRNGKVATLTVGLSHDVSSLLGIGRQLGSQPRANTSITIMRAPQRGHGQGSTCRASGVISGCFCGSAGRQIMATQCNSEQKPHPGHDPVAVADARSALDKVQLETPHLVRRRRIGRALQPGSEPLAARNVAALSVRNELACSHVLDHALTQRTDSFSVAHGEFHPE